MIINGVLHFAAIYLPLLAFAAGALASESQGLPSPPKGPATLVEVEFAYLAARLHTSGIEISKLEEARGSSATLKALAATIRDGQEHVRPDLIRHAKDAGIR